MICGRVLLRDAQPKTRGFRMDPLPRRGGGFGTGGHPHPMAHVSHGVRFDHCAVKRLAEKLEGARFGGCPGCFLKSNYSPLCPRKAQLSVRERLSRSEPLLTILSARRSNGTLKRLLCMPSLTCTVHHAPSRAYHPRKREEGKVHRWAVVALVKCRVSVLWAMLGDERPYEDRNPEAARLRLGDAYGSIP